MNSNNHDKHAQTYCYQGILTTTASIGAGSSDSDPSSPRPDCFSVSSSPSPSGRGGTYFTRVFHHSDSDSEDRLEIRPGYAIPGLWDGHGHLMQYGEFLHSADLFGADSSDEVRRRLVEYLEQNPAAGSRDNWARGVGWDQMLLGGMPFAAGDFLVRLDCLRRGG
jgi:hypothetical protein